MAVLPFLACALRSLESGAIRPFHELVNHPDSWQLGPSLFLKNINLGGKLLSIFRRKKHGMQRGNKERKDGEAGGRRAGDVREEEERRGEATLATDAMAGQHCQSLEAAAQSSAGV